jgi:Ala-tRNA(Pro) deacylase
MAVTDKLTGHLDREGIRYQLLRHPRTYTAADEAEALGMSTDDVAKTVVLATEHGFVRAVVPASHHVDPEKVQRLLGLSVEPRLATESELVAAYPDFEIGAVPPVGGPGGDRVVVDSRLAEHDTVVFEGGSHGESIRLRTRDLLVDAIAEVGDICSD